MRTIYDNAVVKAYAAAVNTTGSLITTSDVVDTKNYNTGALRVFVSPLPSSYLTPSTVSGSLTAVLQESDTATGTFTTANDNGGNAIQVVATQSTSTTATLSDARIEGLGMSNRKRFLRVQATAVWGVGNGTTTAKYCQFSSVACIELGRAYVNPVTTTASNT